MTDFHIYNSVPLSRVGFSIEYFTADFSQFSSIAIKVFSFVWPAGYSLLIPSIPGIFSEFPNFPRSKFTLFDNSGVNSYSHFLIIIF